MDKFGSIYMKRLFLVVLFLIAQNFYAQEESQKFLSSDTGLNAIPISVTIGGDFIVTGSFPTTNVERLDQFITRIYNSSRNALLTAARSDESLNKISEQLQSYAKRNIKLIRKDGSEKKIDLLKFRLTADFKHNPYLKDGDVIIFPTVDLERNFIEIIGAVNKPDVYQFVKGDLLTDIIFYAQGISDAFEDVEFAEISRLSDDGLSEETFKVKIDSNFLLRSGDRINILTNESLKKKVSAYVFGEVFRPGKIFITEKNTSVSDAIEKAGGLKTTASKKYVKLIQRDDLKKLRLQAFAENSEFMDKDLFLKQNSLYDQLELAELLTKTSLTVQDTALFNAESKLRFTNQWKDIDLAKLNENSSFESKLRLNDGDILLIPEKKKSIYVFGQVKRTGYFDFEEGKSYQEYLTLAGGFSREAEDEDEVMIIKGLTKDWIYADEFTGNLEPGDYIYVPKNPPVDTWWYVGKIGAVAGIVGSIATVVLLLTQF